MATLKKQNEGSKSSTQAIIPYKTMFPDGTCHISGKRYSQTVEFYDTNYQLATFDEKGVKFTNWCDILNYFDESIEFQNTYENQIIDKDAMIKYVKIDDVDDDETITLPLSIEINPSSPISSLIISNSCSNV